MSETAQLASTLSRGSTQASVSHSVSSRHCLLRVPRERREIACCRTLVPKVSQPGPAVGRNFCLHYDVSAVSTSAENGALNGPTSSLPPGLISLAA